MQKIVGIILGVLIIALTPTPSNSTETSMNDCKSKECFNRWVEANEKVWKWLLKNSDNIKRENIETKTLLSDGRIFVSYDNSGTHLRVELIDTDDSAKMIGDGTLKIISENPLKYRLLMQKSYGGHDGEPLGAFWYNTVRNADNEIIQFWMEEGLFKANCITKKELLQITSFKKEALKHITDDKICRRIETPQVPKEEPVTWTQPTIKTDQTGLKTCETRSSQGLGIRLFNDGNHSIAFIDVVEETISHLPQFQNTGDAVQAEIVVPGYYSYGTNLVNHAQKTGTNGSKKFILAFAGSHSHMTDAIKAGHVMRVWIDVGNNHNKAGTIKPHLLYSLKGSKHVVEQLERDCWQTESKLAKKTEKIMLCDREGCVATILEKSGIGTRSAWMTATVTEDDARLFCTEYSYPDWKKEGQRHLVDHCVKQELKTGPSVFRITADCVKRTITNGNGMTYAKTHNSDPFLSWRNLTNPNPSERVGFEVLNERLRILCGA